MNKCAPDIFAPEAVHMNNDIRFWDKIAPKYSKNPISDEESYNQKLEKTRTYFNADSKVLEFGCGTGSTAIAHSAFVQHILATDISSEMLAIAKSKADAEGIKNVTFEQATLDDLTSPAESFDVVLGLSILHLVENRDTAISQVHSLLKPGGVFVSSTACLGDKMWFIGLFAPIARFFGIFPMLKIFTIKQLVKSLTNAGFEIDHQWLPPKSPAVFVVAKKK